MKGNWIIDRSPAAIFNVAATHGRVRAIGMVLLNVCALVIMLALHFAFTGGASRAILLGDVTTTNFLEDAKMIYGSLKEQVSTLAMLINLFQDGSKFAKPVGDIGIRGWTFLARLAPNWNMGYRKEGVVGVGAAGNIGLKQATVNLKYAYVPVLITGQAENLTKGQGKAFMQAKALEAKFDTKDLMRMINIIVAGGDRGGVLATVAAAPAPAAGTFSVVTTAGSKFALFLRVGQPIDCMPAGGGALTVTNSAIATINYTSGAITHAAGVAVAGNVVTHAGHGCAIVDFPLTAECLHSLIDDTGAIQGLNPATAGQERWKSYIVDKAAADISPALLMEQRQFTKNRGGVEPNVYITSSAQINKYASLATVNTRFDAVGPGAAIGKKALDFGFTTFNYGGLPMIEEMDAQPDDVFCGNSDEIAKFEALPLSMANDGAGEWTRVSGASGIADAVQGLLRWYHNIGITQRSAWSRYKGYSVAATWSQNPSSL